MTTPVRPDRLLRFGEFELDRDARELRRNGTRVPLPEQPFRLLTVLLQRPGTIATRDELRERLWGTDTFVGLRARTQRRREAAPRRARRLGGAAALHRDRSQTRLQVHRDARWRGHRADG